jgi:hypothetical protein
LLSQTHMKGLPHPHQRCLRTFIVCCGWADRSTIIIPLPPFLLAPNGLQLGYEWCHGALVAAPWPMWKGFHIHSKHIQGVWEYSYLVEGQRDPPSFYFHHTCWSQI